MGTTTPLSEEVCTGDGVGSGDGDISFFVSVSIAGVSGVEGGVCTGFSARGSLSNGSSCLCLSDCSGFAASLIFSLPESETFGFSVCGCLFSSCVSLSGTSESFSLGFDVVDS